MIQMASAYCSVINGGSYYKPHVVKQVLAPDGTIEKEEWLDDHVELSARCRDRTEALAKGFKVGE